MESVKAEKTITFRFDQDNENFEVKLKRKPNAKPEELYVSLENDDSDFWDFSCNQEYLLQLDPIFKKIPDMSDIMDIIQENSEAGTLSVERKGENAILFFKVKFIKAESNVKFVLKKRSKDDENPLATELRSLRKELELLKQRRRIPIISYIGQLGTGESVSGDFVLKATTNVIFQIFIDYKTNYGSNVEESLSLQIKNEKFKEEEKEKTIFKTWFGTYQSGSGYHDSKNVNFFFSEKAFQGKNKVILKKNGSGSQIYTLYLMGEF